MRQNCSAPRALDRAKIPSVLFSIENREYPLDPH
jgi:hypothetical protein